MARESDSRVDYTFAEVSAMGNTISFTRPDGASAPGYLAEPPSAAVAPGVVMFEEWWGLTEQIKETADRLAGDGFRVLVPDFYRGQVGVTREEAGHLSEGLNFGDVATQDAPGAARYLRDHGSSKVAVMGFCMGGAVAMLAAMKNPGAFDAVVTWYGFAPADAGDPKEIAVPMQGHFARHDEFFKPDYVDTLELSLKEGGRAVEFHRYDARHGFYNNRALGQGGLGHYDREAAETAWRRTVDFLTKTLKR